MAAIFEHSQTIQLDPKPGFVVKSKIVEGRGDHLYSTKVFVNICHDPRVPKPPVDFKPEVVFPLIVRNEWEIPIIVSLEKKDVDKKGVPSFVYDCCINSEAFQWVQVSKDLRMILVEWALESVEMMHELVLDRECAFPKMLCKGELSATEITEEDLKNGLQKRLLELKQSETAGLIQELESRRSSESQGSENLEVLPDLLNIDGKRKKPLIEEIGEMTLNEEPKQVTRLDPARNTGITSLPSRKIDDKEISNGPEVLRYEFTIQREIRDKQCFVLFESQQLTENVEVSYEQSGIGSADSASVSIKNTDKSRILGKSDSLEIPVPGGFRPYKSFLLERKGQLYVFCEKIG